MDRSRDDSRRGSFSGCPVSAPRRPRSYGFKDSSVVDDDDTVDDTHNSRLRDRSKKDSSSIPSLHGTSSSSMTSASKHKRKRPISKEAQVHGHASGPVEMREAIEDSEMGVSGDDDDLPTSTLTRRTGKMKSQGKMLDEGNAVDISAVPRKVRTAVAKRPQEPTGAPLGNRTRPHSLGAATLQPVPMAPPPSTSSDAFKPARRTKPNGAKLRVTKVSTPSAISEQEVEVAEALFDLARMIPKQRSPSFSQRKFEVKLEGIREPMVSAHSLPLSPPASLFSQASSPVPAQACSPTSPVSSPLVWSPTPVLSATSAPLTPLESVAGVAQVSAEVSKKKSLPRVRANVEELPLSQSQPVGVTASKFEVPVSDPKEGFDHTTESVGSDRAQVKTLVNVAGQSSSTLLGYEHACSSVSMAMWVSDHQRPSAENISVGTGDKRTPDADCSGTNFFDRASTPASSTESKSVLINTALHESKHTQQEGAGECKPRQENHNDLTQPEGGQSLSKASLNDITHHGKHKIDLMVFPVPSANGTSEKMGISLDPVMLENKRDPAFTASHSDWIDKKITKDEKDDVESKMGNDNSSKQMTGTDNSSNQEYGWQENLKDMRREVEKMEISKQASSQILKNVKSNSKLQQTTDRLLVSSFPMATVAGSNSISGPLPPRSMGMENWKGSVHHMGYYTPAAAAAAVTGVWPERTPNGRAVCMEGKSAFHLRVPSFGFSATLHPYKHCAAHVYIAHFIDVHQQMCRYPLWASTYGKFNYTKPHSPNVPVPHDAMFSTHGSEENGLSLYVDASTRKGHDASTRKGHTQKSAQERQERKRVQAGQVPTFGYSITDASASSSFSSSRVLASENAGSGTGTGLASSPASVISSGISTLNGNVVSAAAAQAQYLQAMIQQAGLLFSFPHGHFGPSMNALPGHITQQQLQPGPSAGSCETPAVNASEQQHLNLQQGAVVMESESRQQLQQSSQSRQHVGSQQLQRSFDRGDIAERECKFTSLQRNVLCQGLPNMQLPTNSSSSPVTGAGGAILPGQKHSLVGALGRKQAVKLQKQQHQSSMQKQAQQQVMFSTDIQQRPNSALYTNLKGLDAQAPQASSTTSMGVVNKSSVGPGPLGLAPVAAVMAPQGHVILQTMAENGGRRNKILQEQLHQPHLNTFLAKTRKPVMEEGNSNVAESKNDHDRESKDHKWTFGKRIPAPSGPSGLDLPAPTMAQCSPLAYNCSGLTPACTPGNLETSFNLLVSAVGNPSSRHILPAPIGFVAAPTSSTSCSTNSAIGNTNLMLNTTVSPNDTTSCSFSDGTFGASCASDRQVVTSVSQSPRQVEAAGQHSSPRNSAPKMQLLTTAVSTALSALAPGMYAGSTITNYQGQPARGQRPSLNAMPASRLPSLVADIYMAGSLPVPPSPVTSKLTSSTAVKTSMLTKTSFNLSQKQSGANMGKTSGPLFTHSTETVLGPNPIATKMGESHSQKILHQHGQHNIKPKQQHHQYQELSRHRQLQQVYSSGGQQAVMQYSQQMMTNQVGPHGSHKESVQLQFQDKPQPFVQEQRLEQQQQQSTQWAQSYSIDQQSMPHHTQQQSVKTVQQQSSSALAQTSQQHFVTQHETQQSNKNVTQQSVLSVQQPLMFPSLGVVSSGAVSHTSGTNIGRMVSSDGALNQAAISGALTPVKGGLPSGSNTQKNNNVVSSFIQSHVGNSSLQHSFNQDKPSPYLQSVLLSSSPKTMVQPGDEKCLTGAASGQLSVQTPSRVVITNAVSSDYPQSVAAVVCIGGQKTTSGSVEEDGSKISLVISGSALQAMPSSGNFQSTPP